MTKAGLEEVLPADCPSLTAAVLLFFVPFLAFLASCPCLVSLPVEDISAEGCSSSTSAEVNHCHHIW